MLKTTLKMKKYWKMQKKANKCKIKVSPLKSLLQEINYVLGKHCQRSPKSGSYSHEEFDGYRFLFILQTLSDLI